MSYVLFCIGLLTGYIIRMLVEDTDKEYECMEHYQNIIKELLDE